MNSWIQGMEFFQDQFFGNTTIPFVDRFPQNTELYAIMTTRPEDKKQEMNRA